MSISDERWDLNFRKGKEAEAMVFEHLTGVSVGTVEVKCDDRASSTGNLYIEYEQLKKEGWRPSGIATSQSDAYAFVLQPSDAVIILPTQVLKKYARLAYQHGRQVSATLPDDRPTRGVLVRITDVLRGLGPSA
jgi:hypothetical protein